MSVSDIITYIVEKVIFLFPFGSDEMFNEVRHLAQSSKSGHWQRNSKSA